MVMSARAACACNSSSAALQRRPSPKPRIPPAFLVIPAFVKRYGLVDPEGRVWIVNNVPVDGSEIGARTAGGQTKDHQRRGNNG